ncbi:hypothetical protein ACH4YO_08065 [Streptomyces noursei]|uniref:hypothetical protein n=1 Tax=Streptomyces noursei TaxID=1971 RepID=UPI0033DBAD1B
MNCDICAMWNDMDGNQIIRTARYVGCWGDGNPVHLCAGCKSSGTGRGEGTPISIDDYYQECDMTKRGVSLAKAPAIQPTEAVLTIRRMRNEVRHGLSRNNPQALKDAFALSVAA